MCKRSIYYQWRRRLTSILYKIRGWWGWLKRNRRILCLNKNSLRNKWARSIIKTCDNSKKRFPKPDFSSQKRSPSSNSAQSNSTQSLSPNSKQFSPNLKSKGNYAPCSSAYPTTIKWTTLKKSLTATAQSTGPLMKNAPAEPTVKAPAQNKTSI